MKAKLIILSILLFAGTISLFSQDAIYKKSGDTIYCTINEVGDEVLKYYLLDFSNSTLFTINKEKVSKVVFSNGKELTFQNEMTNPEN